MSKPYVIRPVGNRTRSIVRIANSLGIEVKKAPAELLGGGLGFTEIYNKKAYVLVADDLSAGERRLTIAHELAHLFLGHLIGIADKRFEVSPEQAEFEAESLGFILYNFLYGIDGGRKLSGN